MKKAGWASALVAVILLAVAVIVEAQQPKGKIPRLGYLTNTSASDRATVLRRESFHQGLSDLGYVEGKNIKIEYRHAEGKFERLLELANELVRLNVDIIVVPNDLTARAAKKATTTIPIVMASSGNPIGAGVIASLAHPGGNVTGLTSLTPELLGKRLELLKEVVPKVSRFGFLNTAESVARPGGSRAAFEEAQAGANALGIQLQLVEVKDQNPDFDGAFRSMVKDRIGALVISPVPAVSVHRLRILQLVERNRLPAMHPNEYWTAAGGLMSYGPNEASLYRRAAMYVDKVLKGTKPADLPVEQPTKFDFVINLKTATQIGLTIPQSVLYRADKVIK